ncbi:MAG: transglutaminase domain-containing protein [Planctomycetes bacterium]|nr:transglutaminase domain-containing protein [Planctomycetota bacterium]MCC7171603.1 transglutaminase domain-containing protein [Planctomycetota bacterium]
MSPFRSLLSTVLAFVVTTAGLVHAGETWHVMKFSGADSGYLHTVSTPTEFDGGPATRTITETKLVVRRMNKEITLSMSSMVIENAAGRIIAKTDRQELSGTPNVYQGVAVDDEFVCTVEGSGAKREFTVEWPEDIPGPEELKRRMLATGLKEGSVLRVMQHDFSFGDPMELTVTIGPVEDIVVGGKTMRLHRTTSRLPGMPETTSWVDAEGESWKTATAMAGVEMISEMATRDAVAAFIDGTAQGAEMFMQSTISANVRLPRPRSLTSITYQVVPRKAGDAAPDLSSETQTMSRDAEGKTLLTIVARTPAQQRRQALPITAPAAELREFLEPNSFLQSDEPEILALAKEGVGDATDPWIAAQRLEALVHRTISKKSMDVVFASALEVCRTKEGDCSEHAMLLAGLCRAAGIPARVAMGLVYVGGIFGGHAWTEVSIDGEWYGLDGTIGHGVVDPTHVRMGVSSLKGGSFGEAMIGITRGLGTIDLKIVEFARGAVVTRVPSKSEQVRNKDGRFEDVIAGVSFEYPRDFTVEFERPDILEMSNKAVIAVLRKGTSTVRVSIEGVQPETTRASREQLPDEAERDETRAIAGHPGIVGENQDGTLKVAVVVVGDSAYRIVGTECAIDDGKAGFDQVVATLWIE